MNNRIDIESFINQSAKNDLQYRIEISERYWDIARKEVLLYVENKKINPTEEEIYALILYNFNRKFNGQNE